MTWRASIERVYIWYTCKRVACFFPRSPLLSRLIVSSLLFSRLFYSSYFYPASFCNPSLSYSLGFSLPPTLFNFNPNPIFLIFSTCLSSSYLIRLKGRCPGVTVSQSHSDRIWRRIHIPLYIYIYVWVDKDTYHLGVSYVLQSNSILVGLKNEQWLEIQSFNLIVLNHDFLHARDFSAWPIFIYFVSIFIQSQSHYLMVINTKYIWQSCLNTCGSTKKEIIHFYTKTIMHWIL